HLLRELDHRVKNNLANLFSLVSLYERQANDQAGLAELIRNKILALKRTHEALAINQWSGLDMRRLVLAMADAGTHWDNIEPRLQLDVPSLHVSLRQAPALAMVFHELFSHSREFGALSSPTGKVTLEVHVIEPNHESTRVRLSWSEAGGSSVLGTSTHPHKGLAMIEGLTRFELSGSATFHSSDHGFSCTLVIRLDLPTSEQEAPEETAAIVS
ncbi:MAG: sensor histidine kinase, partial [Phycisphaerales bacterium]|nr:sensor histidine kinase [Phycisphaerales bacterium]